MRKKPILFDYKSDYFDFFQLTSVNGKNPPPKKICIYIYIRAHIQAHDSKNKNKNKKTTPKSKVTEEHKERKIIIF
jgi:hypothetical protein